uniref:Uncharacterized protein n=1 Tax=Cacopsylla melanoneura TaxID=428564 RepID=A0A8D8QPP1_9HEMI
MPWMMTILRACPRSLCTTLTRNLPCSGFEPIDATLSSNIGWTRTRMLPREEPRNEDKIKRENSEGQIKIIKKNTTPHQNSTMTPRLIASISYEILLKMA